MKKTLLILSLFCASSLAASAATVWYDFNADNKSKVVGGSSDYLQFATGGAASTVKVGLSLTATNSGTTAVNSKDWRNSSLPSWNSTLIADTTGAPIGDAWKTFIGGNQKNIGFTATISGLTPGQAYGVYVITGTPFEAAGAWNALKLVNSPTAQRLTGTGWTNWETTSLEVQKPSNLGATNVIADGEGNIKLTFDNKGAHTSAINALAITGVADAVPEPATASLGLLGLAALMLRRRRA